MKLWMTLAGCLLAGLVVGCGAAAESELQKERQARAVEAAKLEEMSQQLRKQQAELEAEKGSQETIAAAGQAVKRQLDEARQALEETRQKFLSAEAARVAGEKLKEDLARQLEQLKPLSEQVAASKQQLKDLAAQVAVKDKLLADKEAELQKALNELRRLHEAIDRLGGDVSKHLKFVMPPETPPPQPPK